jgi:hypothetical protein
MNNTFRKAALLFASLGAVTGLAQEKPKTPELVQVGAKPQPCENAERSPWDGPSMGVGGVAMLAGRAVAMGIINRLRRGGPSPYVNGRISHMGTDDDKHGFKQFIRHTMMPRTRRSNVNE